MIDEATKTYMKKPRCGVPDYRRVNISLHTRRKRNALQGKIAHPISFDLSFTSPFGEQMSLATE